MLTPPTRLTVHIPDNLRALVDDYATVVGLSRGAIIRIAVAEFFITGGRGLRGQNGTNAYPVRDMLSESVSQTNGEDEDHASLQ